MSRNIIEKMIISYNEEESLRVDKMEGYEIDE